jgi:nucleoside-diphosphate-sugar epimerase
MGTVAVTGATGFLGGALARALAEEGHRIVGLKRPSSSPDALSDLDVTWLEGDVTDADSLRGAFDEADWLIHAAGMLGRAGVPERRYFQAHEAGTHHVLAEAERAGVRRVLHVSSPGVLGPIDGPPATETAPLAPSNPYERSKAAAEQVARVYAHGGLPVVIARPEFVYGAGDLHVLGLFRAVRDGRFFYVGDGHNTCHPTYVEDAVAGMLRVLRQGAPGQSYHLAGPRPVTFRQLGETIAVALDVPPPRFSLPVSLAWAGAAALELAGRALDREPPLSRTGVAFFSENRRFSWQKAHRDLGYTPQFDLERGVRETVAWYRTYNYL